MSGAETTTIGLYPSTGRHHPGLRSRQ